MRRSPYLLFFLFFLKVSLSPAGPPPEIIYCYLPPKKYEKKIPLWSGNNKLNSVGFPAYYIDDFEEACGFYNRSNGESHRMWTTRSRDNSRTPRLKLRRCKTTGLRRCPVTAIIKRIRKDSQKSSALTKLQKAKTESQHNFTPSTMFSVSFHFSYFLRRYGILCLSLNNFKEA